MNSIAPLIRMTHRVLHHSGYAASLVGCLLGILVFTSPAIGQDLTFESAAAPMGFETLPVLPDDHVFARLGINIETTPTASKQPSGFAFVSEFFPLDGYSGGDGTATNYAFAHSGGILPGAHLIGGTCLPCLDPYVFNKRTSDLSVSVALGQTDRYLLPFLNSGITGGNWNQFFGQYPAPTGWNTNVSGLNPGFSGGAYPTSNVFLQSVLGYDSSSPLNFTTQFSLNMGSLFSPTTNWQNPFGLYPNYSERAFKQAGNSLAERYSELGRMQVHFHYTDRQLKRLRADAYVVINSMLYLDPVYMYYSYLLNTEMQRIYQSRPSYRAYVLLASEIAGWTTPSSNRTTLYNRYVKRYQLAYLQSRVQYEAMQYLAANQQYGQWVVAVSRWLTDSAIQKWSTNDVSRWYEGLEDQFASEYASDRRLNNAAQELVDDFPQFEEYVKLNNQIIASYPKLRNRARVRTATRRLEDVISDPNVARKIAAEYDQYRSTIQRLLGRTTFITEVERYYERVNGQVTGDSKYKRLTNDYSENYDDLLQFQYNVALAVDICLRTKGSSCNPLTDQNVQRLYNSNDVVDLLEDTASIVERYNRYWYDYFRSSRYRTLEQEAQNDIQPIFARITPGVIDAKEDFERDVNRITEIRRLNSDMSRMVSDIRRVTASNPGKNGGSAAISIGRALDRMEDLADALNEAGPRGPAGVANTSAAFEEVTETPDTIKLLPNYPNPFNPTTTIRYDLPEAAEVSLTVYDMLGRKVASLVNGRQESGSHEVQFKADNLPSGLYVYTLEAGTFKES